MIVNEDSKMKHCGAIGGLDLSLGGGVKNKNWQIIILGNAGAGP